MIPNKPQGARWTDEQWRAIYETGQNILVSAGAGSGKTAVLTARIIEKLKQGVKLENLVVLTFTKAATSEMNDRIRKALTEEVEKPNASCVDLKGQLDYLDQANIKTIDSFSLSIVKKYHYLLNVSKDIQIGDDAVFVTLKKKIIDEIFDEGYLERREGFTNLVKTFCIKNDDKLKRDILAIQDKIDLLVEPAIYLDNYQQYLTDEEIDKRCDEITLELANLKEQIKEQFSYLLQVITDQKLVEHVLKCRDQTEGILTAKKYLDYFDAKNTKLPIKPKSSNVEELELIVKAKDEIKTIIASIKEICIYDSVESMKALCKETRKYVKEIVRIINLFNQRLSIAKKDSNVYQFSDIGKMAIKVLKENEAARLELKNNISEILIDEYQDTNDIQETLVSLISSNNVYMVGDVKQSIYRFRNANPDIFMEKYKDFKTNNTGLVIDLNKNFRSRRQVLDPINYIFKKIMDEALGGTDYTADQQLVFGNKKYDEFDQNPNNTLEVLKIKAESSAYSKDEIEAITTAGDILNKISSGYKVYDPALMNVRGARFSDFAILTATKTKFDIYRKVFDYFQIPMIIYKDENFTATNVVIAIKNLLKCFLYLSKEEEDYKSYELSLASVLRSFIVNADDDDLFALFTTYKNNLNEGLKLLFPEFIQTMSKCLLEAKNASITEILGVLLQNYDVYGKLYTLDGAELAEEHINYLVTLSIQQMKLSSSLKEFIDYIDGVSKENDIKFAKKIAKGANAVTFINIHKSKGLEYNICYYLYLDHRFNKSEKSEAMFFNKKLGIITKAFDEGLKETIYRKLLSTPYDKDIVSEQIRLFYVALTRAKDKIILVQTSDIQKEQTDGVAAINDRIKCKSFSDFLAYANDYLAQFTNEVIFDDTNQTYGKDKKRCIAEDVKGETLTFREVEVKKIQVASFKASKRVELLIDHKTKENLEFGTKIHKILQLIDFTDPILSLANIRKTVSITDAIVAKIEKFFKVLPIGVINDYHEMEFMYEKGNTTIHGIIDLVLETNDMLYVIDYKLNNIDKEQYVKQLQVYNDYLAFIGKPVTMLLYSILQEKTLQIS